jgi:glycosyltransferase involved in cell wall biosynthesis
MSKAQFTISAVIPTRNRASRLARAIESVLAQSAAVTEIVVVDDGSEDNTREVVSRYAPLTKYVRREGNGVAAARNAGVQAATSDWIAFLDDDDEWMPDKIETQVAALAEARDAVGCYAPPLAVCEDGRSEIHWAVPPERLSKDVFLRNPFTQCSLLMQKAYFLQAGGFDVTLGCGEDWEFCFRAIRGGGRFVMIDRPLLVVHETDTSFSKRAGASLESERRVIELLVAQIALPMRIVWKLRMLSRSYYRAATAARIHKSPDQARYLLRSLLYWPSPLFEFRRYKTLGLWIKESCQTKLTTRREHA